MYGVWHAYKYAVTVMFRKFMSFMSYLRYGTLGTGKTVDPNPHMPLWKGR